MARKWDLPLLERNEGEVKCFEFPNIPRHLKQVIREELGIDKTKKGTIVVNKGSLQGKPSSNKQNKGNKGSRSHYGSYQPMSSTYPQRRSQQSYYPQRRTGKPWYPRNANSNYENLNSNRRGNYWKLVKGPRDKIINLAKQLDLEFRVVGYGVLVKNENRIQLLLHNLNTRAKQDFWRRGWFRPPLPRRKY